ncbi:MAG: hypothetical protein U0132_18065 [Gemmatimonadaceae bacterium]
MIAFTAPQAKRLIEIVAGASTLVGSLELLMVRQAFRDDGVWRWSTLSRELGILRWLLAYRPFVGLLLVRVVASGMLIGGIGRASVPVLWVTTLLISVRFRGAFNGGSDSMTMVVLTGLLIGQLGPAASLAVQIGLLYIASQAILSYFIAGVVKLGNSEWRDGSALAVFIARPEYGTPAPVTAWRERTLLLTVASWAVIGFECLFPLALAHQYVAGALVLLAFLFHLGNAWVFGLNRFLWAWAASWPAILYAATIR